MATPPIVSNGNITNSSGNFYMDFADFQIRDEGTVSVSFGDYTDEVFLSPNYFPMKYGNYVLNLSMFYEKQEQTMTVELLDFQDTDKYGPRDSAIVSSESIDTSHMSTAQKMFAFMYLIGVVTDGY